MGGAGERTASYDELLRNLGSDLILKEKGAQFARLFCCEAVTSFAGAIKYV